MNKITGQQSMYSDAGLTVLPDINERKNLRTPYQNNHEILDYESLDVDSNVPSNKKRQSVMTVTEL